MTTGLGGALLRVLGSADRKPGDPNPASKADAFEIIDSIMESADFRKRCSVLSNLSQDVPMAARKQACRALLILMTSTRVPLEEPPMVGDCPDYDAFKNTTPEYAALAAPPPSTNWAAHLDAKYKRTAVAEFVRVSPYMAELMIAFEDLFGIPGSLLSR